MDSKRLHDEVEDFHKKANGAHHPFLWKLRMVELGELIHGGLTVARETNALAAQEYVLDLLESDGRFETLYELIKVLPELWKLLESRLGPDQFVANLGVLKMTFPEATADLTILQQPHTPDGQGTYTRAPVESLQPAPAPSEEPGDDNTAVPNPDTTPVSPAEKLRRRAEEIRRGHSEHATELAEIMTKALAILAPLGESSEQTHEVMVSLRERAMNELKLGRRNASLKLIKFIRDDTDDQVRMIFRGDVPVLGLYSALKIFVSTLRPGARTAAKAKA